MGRRADPPELQAAKGDPGRRKGARVRRAQDREAAAAALAALPLGTNVEPPEQLRSKGYEDALKVWRELGPELERTHRLQPLHVQAFAMFCIYIAEFWQASADLAKNGRTQRVPTVSGGVMERERPAVRWRAEAFSNAMEAAKQFGLTPREEYALFKDQSVVKVENPGLFTRGGSAAEAPANDAAPADAKPASTLGLMGRMRGEPPAVKH